MGGGARVELKGAAFGVGLLYAALIGGTAQAGTAPPRTMAFTYESGTGRPVKAIIEPDNSTLCLVTEFGYDAYGNRTSATSRNCAGAAPEAAAPTGDAVFTSRTATATFAAGSTLIGGTTYAWNTGQFATGEANALGHADAREFDPRFGWVVRLTGPNSLVTTWGYDGFGRAKSESRADGTSSQWNYIRCTDSPGSCPASGRYYVTVTATGAPSRRVVFDGLEREVAADVQSFDGSMWSRTETEYDSVGRVSRKSRPYFLSAGTPVWTTYQYDALGRVSSVTEPDPGNGQGSLVTTTAYSGFTWSATETRNTSPAQVRTTSWDAQGRVVVVTDALGKSVSYGYSLAGDLSNVTAGGVVTTTSYDVRGRKTATSNPDLGAWSYAYNALGELIRQTDAKGQVTTFAYDRLSRPTQKSRPDLVHTWSYDGCTKGMGKLCQIGASNDYGRTLGYDSLGRVASIATTIGTSTYAASYAYDAAGRPEVLTYPTGFAVRNVYNGAGHLWQVQRADAGGAVFWQANAKNPAGAVTSESLGNGAATSRGYDPLYRLTSVVSSSASGTLQNLGYGYDKAGNVSTRADYVQSIYEGYAYDVLNRLKQISGLTTRSFDYDALGNVIYKSDVGSYTYPAASAARPHAVSSVTNGGVPSSITASYGYDANGNLTSASGTIYPASGAVSFSRTLTYTSFNRPATISQTQGGYGYSYTYTYGAEEERVRLITVRPDDTLTSIYIHPGGGGALLYEKETRQSNGRVEHKHYVAAPTGVVGVYVTKSSYDAGDGPQMRYTLRDALDSIGVIANESGAVSERLGYEGFGERRYSNGTPQDRSSPIVGIQTDRGYTGHEHLDEANLIHMNGRVYDPALGRFMTPDPSVPYVLNLQSHNRYSYVQNNPLRGIDPTGFSDESGKRKQNTGQNASALPVQVDFTRQRDWSSIMSSYTVTATVTFSNGQTVNVTVGTTYGANTTGQVVQGLNGLAQDQFGNATGNGMGGVGDQGVPSSGIAPGSVGNAGNATTTLATVRVTRVFSTNNSTIGAVTVDGADTEIGYTLEPPGPSSSTEGSGLRIPAGEYPLERYSSAQFPNALQIVGVPGRTNILVHPGNFPIDTSGCLLPGRSYGVDRVFDSVQMMNRLRDYIGDNSARIVITD